MTQEIENLILEIESEVGVGVNTKVRVGNVLRKIADEKPYTVYTALLTQTGTGAPVATILENTITGITFSYVSDGIYRLNKTGAFDPNKTTVSIGNIKYPQDVFAFRLLDINMNYIEIGSYYGPGYTNDIIANWSVQVRVYN